MPKFKFCIELGGIPDGWKLYDIIEAEDLKEAERRVREYAESMLETWAEPVEEGTEDA